MKRSGIWIVSLITLASLVLAGCMDLAADITPPPEVPRSAEPAAFPTAAPSQTPDSPDESIPTATVTGEEGTVAVQVLDQTGGSLLAGGLQVVLVGYDQFDQVYQDELVLPADGSVTFRDVPFEPGRVFFASVPYGGAIYRSDIVQVEQETTLNLQVEIFETTTDTSNLQIDRLHVLIDFPQSGLIQVTEIFILSNLGTQTVVSGAAGEPSAEFSLPADAGSIQFEDGSLGQRYLLTDDGFGDTVSIPPGEGVYQVLVYFNLPFQGRRLDFEQTINYPLNAAVVMVPAGSATIKGAGLEDLGVQTLPETSVQVYSAQAIPRGGILDFQLRGVSQDATSSFSTSQILVFGAGALGILLLGAGVWLYFKNREGSSQEPSAESGQLSQEEILDSILALDDLFQGGEISRESYQRKRSQLKKQLKKAAGGDE